MARPIFAGRGRREEARTVAEKVIATGSFIGARCPRCGVVKRPLRDAGDDDGGVCSPNCAAPASSRADSSDEGSR